MLTLEYIKSLCVVNPITGCWDAKPATPVTTDGGYPLVYDRNISIRMLRANRESFRLANGHYPKNMACHWCGNKRCLNPEHLYDGDSMQNRRDAEEHGTQPLSKPKKEKPPKVVSKPKASKVVRLRGNNNGGATGKIDDAAVRDIRSGKMRPFEYARKYGVSSKTIRNIRDYKNWGWVI